MKKIILHIAFILLFSLTSCISRLTPARLFDKNITYSSDNTELLSTPEYRLQPFDALSLDVYTNKGLSFLPLSEKQDKPPQENIFIIDRVGNVFLPYLGEIHASGKTLTEFKDTLIKLYGQIFVDPLINVQLKNRYILVFNGTKDQKAAAIPFMFHAPTLMEVLAQAGGLGNARSSHVEIVRRLNENEVKVYKIDLSMAQNLHYSYVHLLPGDMVLLKEYPIKLQDIMMQISPWLTILSTLIIVLNYIKF